MLIGYARHGETYLHPDDILWWSKGGTLHGESWKMTITRAPLVEPPASPPVRGVATTSKPAFGVNLPGKPYLALRVRRKVSHD